MEQAQQLYLSPASCIQTLFSIPNYFLLCHWLSLPSFKAVSVSAQRSLYHTDCSSALLLMQTLLWAERQLNCIPAWLVPLPSAKRLCALLPFFKSTHMAGTMLLLFLHCFLFVLSCCQGELNINIAKKIQKQTPALFNEIYLFPQTQKTS